MEPVGQQQLEPMPCPPTPMELPSQEQGEGSASGPDGNGLASIEGEPSFDWKRSVSGSTRCSSGVESSRCGGSKDHAGHALPVIEPDAEAEDWEEVKESTAEKGGIWRWPKLSWYVETRHGKQHLKQVVLDRKNWFAGITVALVSVPLSISLGIASGTTPMRGVAAAVFGGLCAGFFGSSDYNIVGPAGALSGMLMSYTVQWGDDVLPWLSLLSAGICLLCTLLRLDIYMLLMPKSVFEGFTVGVALIIGLNQINFACGVTPHTKHPHFVANIVESLQLLPEANLSSLAVFLVQAPSLWYLMRRLPSIPWTVIVPVLSIPLGWLCDGSRLGVHILTLRSKYGMLEPELVQPLRTTSASFPELLFPSFSIAIVAILETLISAKIASDRVDRPFSVTGEMRGLVVSHLVCGGVGAMPPTGVFVRTSLNTTLGATHRFSQVLNALVVAIISLALMPAFSYLPQATIAALLVVAAIRMTPMRYLGQLWREDPGNLALCILTALVCLGADPVIGLGVGMAVALLFTARRIITAPFVEVKSRAVSDGLAYLVHVRGALTYINAEAFVSKMRALDGACEVSLDISGVCQLDHDGSCALGKVLDGWTKHEPGCMVCLRGVGAGLRPALEKLPWFLAAQEQGRLRAP